MIVIGNFVLVDGEVVLIEVFVSFINFKGYVFFFNVVFGFFVFFLEEFECYGILFDFDCSLFIFYFFSVSIVVECYKKKCK